MDTSIYIFLTAIFSLLLGLAIYFMQTRGNLKYFQTTNLITWLLIALFPVLIIFSFFPESSISGTIKGISMGGAIAAFMFIWWFGTKKAIETVRIDRLNAKIDELEKQIINSQRLEQEEDRAIDPQPIQTTKIYRYKVKNQRNKQIALITGDIRRVTVADVWVNSENCNMQMARFFDQSISGIIRYLGAAKDDMGTVTSDTIAKELEVRMGSNLTVQPATVLVTGAGQLEQTNNVQYIFHVGSVIGELSYGYRPVRDLQYCVMNCLREATTMGRDNRDLKSILLPLFGTGSAKGDLPQIASMLLNEAIHYLSFSDTSLEIVYFIVRTDYQLDICKNILEDSAELTAA